MTDDQYEKLIGRFNKLDERMGDLEGRIDDLNDSIRLDLQPRLDGIHADVVTGLAAVNATLSTLALGQVNLFNFAMGHSTDPRAHGKAA